MMTSETSLEVQLQKVGLRFGEQWVFRNLSLTLPAGQWTCLLGGSGVGKTCLLQMMADLIDADRADIQGVITDQHGQSVSHKVAWMAQQDLLMPWLTVWQNILVGCRLRHHLIDILRRTPVVPSQKVALAQQLLKHVDLLDKKDMRPDQLSGGQRQRVALVRTLLEDQPIVLMDEPFAALDAITRLELQDLACELLQHRTVLLITHDPLEALRLGHQVYHLRGSPAQLTDAIALPDSPPRSLENQQLMQLQGVLLNRLRHEQEAYDHA